MLIGMLRVKSSLVNGAVNSAPMKGQHKSMNRSIMQRDCAR